MSDKSFGDHTNRGIVKNPLLSTAVTGMSLDDLTQNAVLLPVSLTQEHFGRQEPTPTPAIPSSDTFAPIHPPEQNAKQKDDFDVNEYFARLQGTRYVSAPINILNDANANLEEKEENLEEINLNEPSVSSDIQQSITADIAQNFSQLPTVLPQVASAVFSSFSNMLSMKREDGRVQGQAVGQGGQGGQGKGGQDRMMTQDVPLMGAEREVAPPPREPPVAGPGNYRLATKKKYAQIPGLSSGESAQMPTYTPAFNQPIFTPPQDINTNFTNTETNIPKVDVGQTSLDFNVFSNTPSIPVDSSNKTSVESKEAANIATPQMPDNQQAIIAPPPMFSNLTKRDSAPNVGKTILPPSVARRIGSNKPTISNQAPAFATFDNIFVPAPVPTDAETTLPPNTSNTSFPTYPPQGVPPQPDLPPNSSVPSTNIAASTYLPSAFMAPPPITTSQMLSSTTISTDITSAISIPGNLPPPPTNFVPPPMIATQPEASTTSYDNSASLLSPPQMYKSGVQSQILTPPTAFVSRSQSQAASQSTSPPEIPISSESQGGTSTLPTTAPPQMFNPYLQGSSVTSQPPAASEIEPPNSHVSILQSGNIESVLGSSEPPKVPEPPKATANTNFRMTKKRPQYYSGPIEGIGAISNNVKPTLPPVAVPAFQGAVFTPAANTENQAAVLTPENVTDVSASHGAIYNPVAENQKQTSMFTPLNVNIDSSNTQNAFDIKNRAQNIGATPFDTNKVTEPSYGSYNTSFDMSRQTTDTYEPPKQESAFGIIGSLKSKLSSIDINKLQNSVTTFFDPGYNVVKTEASQEYQHGYGSNQGIEICVANPEMYPQPYQYDTHQANFTYGQGSIPNASDYYNQQPHNVFSDNSYYSQPSYGTQSYSQTDIQGQQTYNQYSNITSPMSTVDTEASQMASLPTYQPTSTTSYIDENREVENKDCTNSAALVHSNKDNNITEYQGQFVNVPETVKPLFDTNEESFKNLENTEGNNVAVGQNVAEPVGTLLHSSEGTILFQSQIENNAPNTKLEHEKNIDQSFKALQISDVSNVVVEQKLTESFGACSIDSVGDNIAAEIGGHFESNMPTKSHNEEFVSQEFKKVPSNDEGKVNIKQTNAAEDTSPTATLLNPVDTVPSYFDNENTSTAEKAFLDVVNRRSSSINYFDVSGNSENKIVDLVQTEKSNFDNMFSAPLHDLSSMIADKSKEISDNVSELDVDVDDEASDNAVDVQVFNERLMALNDSEKECLEQSEIGQKVDLCETCREVTHPDQKPADFTTQLIENITAPIQLLNPVEVPLTEVNTSVPDDFDTINQGAEISLIAGETIDTLQIQSATELLHGGDNTNTETNYGWRTEAPLPLGQDLLDHDYTFKTKPNAVGFFGSNKLFFDDVTKNACDVIKAEYKVSHDEPQILQRQMSIPTAPPAEDSDDANSDETGALDVQSIEQDASKDFPVFEEYVIEPSETDDDKLDIRDKNDEIKDTFTNRVDRFKQLEKNEDGSEQHKANLSTLMPSYFDTGNYAVEAHFKNSLTSPTISSIPPGFEDFEPTPKGLNKYDPIKVPDTDTQTSLTTTVSNALTKTENMTSTVFSSMPFVQESQAETILPDFASVFRAKIDLKDTSASDISNIEKPTSDTPVNLQVNIEDKVQENKFVALPDPLNFFASNQEPDSTEGVNRLASYFASPAKTDNTKSFFELSQGQNHYRQNKDQKTEEHKPFLQLSQSQDHYKDNINIQHDKYIANLNLMNDLTSYQNMEPAKEQTIRTVNYFTVEYDNPDVLYLNKGEHEIKKVHAIKKEPEYEIEETVLNHDAKIVNECKLCCVANPVLIVRETDFDNIGKVQFRQAMNSGGSEPKEGVTMQPGSEGGRDVSVRMDDISPDGDSSEGVSMMTESRSSKDYEPVKHHWFYRVDSEDKSIWKGFSTTDSRAIENAFQSPDLNENTLVPTDGGRYDVNVVGRLRVAVYWADKPTNVRRCSWFYKGTTDARYVPYTESVAEKLEAEYRHGIRTGEWHRRLSLPHGELVVMHGPGVMVHFLQGGADPFGAPNQSTMRPRVVRRGIDDSEIEDPEPSSVDHLLLLCHGVGSACDMRFRPVEEVVDDFRSTSMQLLQSHYRNSYDSGTVGRVEVLPISWHAPLHAGPRGVDRRVARVTLASIPRLRTFTNDTVLDVLFYTSPHYCQMILDTVCGELNRIYSLFMSRNPGFAGRVSLGGHSLGSVILYDLLCNQPVPSTLSPKPTKTYLTATLAENPTISRYPTLCFEPYALFGLGSPIAIFECIRGVEMLGADFCLPTCPNFFNIFHPYDPIAYRVEPLVNPHLQNVKPSLIPHHKGRKRMHLELKDTMARVGADLKQKLVESIRSTWASMWPAPPHQLEKVVEEEIEKEQLEEDRSNEEPVLTDLAPGEMLGRLNNGRRIDYVLQEAPFEIFNEYLFAMTSHVCYWESEDVMLLILREIYDSMGVQPDLTVPQQSLTVQRPARDVQQVTTNTPEPSTSRT